MDSQYLLRYLITRFLNIHIPGKDRDIAIFSSRRSGSTWLMEMISQAKGMKRVIEPFNEEYVRYNQVLDHVYHQYISLTDAEKDRVIKYLQSDVPSRFCGPVNPLKKTFRFLSSRRIIKSTNANALLPVLAAESDLELAYLIRHPIPQIISARKYPYRSVLEHYVQDERFMQAHLSTQQREFAVDVYRFGNETDHYLAGWCLDNLLPLRLLGRRKQTRLVLLTYEDLVLRTAECMRFVAHRFRLECGDTMRDFEFDVPSWTSRFSSRDRIEAIRNRDKKYLVDSWCNQDLSEFVNLTKILDVFDTSVYRIDNPFADESLRFRE